MKRWLVTVLWILLGYVAAVVSAVIMVEAIIFGPPLVSTMFVSGPDGIVRDLGEIIGIGLYYTTICALPGFIVAIAIGERMHWKRWFHYALAGLANVVPSLALFTLADASLFDLPSFVPACLAGGYLGGTAYWLAAGRRVVARRPALSAPAPSGS